MSIVNLKRARKRVLTEDKKTAADRNALAFGLSKAKKAAAKAANDVDSKRLEGHKRGE